jgi:PAS domain-containing protein
MTQRIRLTLISVCLVALLTGSISIYYLKTEIEKQFQFGLQRADLMKSLAADSVARSLDLHPSIPIPQALLSDSDLADRLRTIMAVSRSLLEITICDNQNKVLLSTDTSRHAGDPFPADYPDYGRLASQSDLLEKIRVLRDEGSPKYYQLSGALGPEGQSPDLFVRVVILPALIRGDILPELQKAAVVSALSIIASILIALVFSNFAFQPLSNLTRMLDTLTRGQYESPAEAPRPQAKADEFGVMVSKVNLLGQQLGNFERLLDQLEEAVLVFGGDRNLIVASGALENFLGKRRVELMGLSMSEIFPPDASVGFFLEQILETGRPVRNFSVRLDGAQKNGDGKNKLSHALLSVELLESFASGTRKNTAAPRPGGAAANQGAIADRRTPHGHQPRHQRRGARSQVEFHRRRAAGRAAAAGEGGGIPRADSGRIRCRALQGHHTPRSEAGLISCSWEGSQGQNVCTAILTRFLHACSRMHGPEGC